MKVCQEQQEKKQEWYISCDVERDNFIVDAIKMRLTDEEARVLINGRLEGYKIPKIKSMPKSLRDETGLANKRKLFFIYKLWGHFITD